MAVCWTGNFPSGAPPIAPTTVTELWWSHDVDHRRRSPRRVGPIARLHPSENAMTRPVPQAAVDLVKQSEGCKLRAYPDPGSGAEPWTIGYGCTGSNIAPGMVIDQDTAEEWLRMDLEETCAEVVRLVQPAGLTDNQLAALISFQFNTGKLATSTMLKLIRERDFKGAAAEFPKWIYASGKVLPGLVTRRAAERALFEKECE